MTRTGSLQNKVAVITGGAKGIGKAVATTLVERGARVIIGDVADKEGEELASTLNHNHSDNVAVFVHADATSWDDNKKLFAVAEEQFGGVDIACMNAGIGQAPDTIFSPLEGESKTMQVNLDGVIKGNKVAILHLAKRGGGVIVNTASVAGFMASSLLPHYNASKHGVVGWTRSLDILQEVANVRVNAICPYWVDTDILLNFNTPGTEFLSKCPKVAMDTVIEAFIAAIEDETRHGETILALPDGIKIEPRINLWESCLSKEMIESMISGRHLQIEETKRQLKEALNRAKM